MKTFYQFNESIGKALAKFGSVGLRKAAKVTLPKFKSKLPKSITKLSKAKNIDKLETKVQNILYNKDVSNKPTQAWRTKSELGRNLIAKYRIKHKSPEGFYGTVKPLPTGGNVAMRTSASAGDVQLQGALKGGEYKRKISGGGDKSLLGSIGGSRGKGNKSLRRSGQSDKVTDYEKKGWKPTPMFRKTKAELGSVAKTPGSGKVEPYKWNPGDTYMYSVDIKQSKAHSKAVREKLKVLQRRQSEIKKGSKGMNKETEAMKKRLEGGL